MEWQAIHAIEQWRIVTYGLEGSYEQNQARAFLSERGGAKLVKISARNQLFVARFFGLVIFGFLNGPILLILLEKLAEGP